MDEHQKGAFLNALRHHHGLEASAAREAGVPLAKVRRAYTDDEAFREMVQEIVEEQTDALEREAHRRAVEGVEEPVHYKGDRVDTVTKYSDTLLVKLLTGRRPDVFGDKREITGKGGAPLTVVIKEFDDGVPDFL